MEEIIFYLASDSYFGIPIDIPENELHMYSAGYIFLKTHGSPNVLTYKGSLFSVIDDIPDKLQQALAGELELDSLLGKHGIGYAYNEYLKQKLNGIRNKTAETAFAKYRLWGTGIGHSITRLYTIADKIFIDISPYYYWHPDYDPRPSEMYISYEEYMKAYKPIGIFEISRETAHQWLAHAQKLAQIMYANSERIENTL